MSKGVYDWRLCLACDTAWADVYGARCWHCNGLGLFTHGWDPAKLLLETKR